MHQGLSSGMPLMTRGSSSPAGTDFWSSRTEINGRTKRHAIFGVKGLSNAVKKCVIYRQIERGKERRWRGAARRWAPVRSTNRLSLMRKVTSPVEHHGAYSGALV